MALFRHMRVPLPKKKKGQRNPYFRRTEPTGSVMLVYQAPQVGSHRAWRKSLGKIVLDADGNECLIPSEFYFLHTNREVPAPETIEDARRPEQREKMRRDIDPDPRDIVPSELAHLASLGLLKD